MLLVGAEATYERTLGIDEAGTSSGLSSLYSHIRQRFECVAIVADTVQHSDAEMHEIARDVQRVAKALSGHCRGRRCLISLWQHLHRVCSKFLHTYLHV